MIARGVWGGDSGKGVFRNYYKGHMDKIKGDGGNKGGIGFEWGGARLGSKFRLL